MDLTLLDPYIDHRIIVAALLGAVIGLEREIAGKDPSIRTFSLISLGSCIFAIISNSMAMPPESLNGISPDSIRYLTDPGRIAAQVVVGIGFLGAGTIFRSRRGVSGLTTAALMWVTAAIGMAIGFDRMKLAVSGTLASIIVLVFFSLLHRVIYYLRGKPSGNSVPE